MVNRGLQSGEEDQYDADHLRRIARSLSGTVIGRRQNRLAVSRSFVSISLLVLLEKLGDLTRTEVHVTGVRKLFHPP